MKGNILFIPGMVVAIESFSSTQSFTTGNGLVMLALGGFGMVMATEGINQMIKEADNAD